MVHIRNNLPTQLRPEESRDSPGGQEHLKDPLVFVQNPPTHISGNNSHSLMSENIKFIKSDITKVHYQMLLQQTWIFF